jgi:hypothetical protein
MFKIKNRVISSDHVRTKTVISLQTQVGIAKLDKYRGKHGPQDILEGGSSAQEE